MPGANTHRHAPLPAGQLLDEVGCRGLRVGRAMVIRQARQHPGQCRSASPPSAALAEE